MQKLVDGKLYDTETATFIVSSVANEGEIPPNGEPIRELLYVTDKGAYFVHTEGNGIEPKSETEAYEWCESNDEIGAAKEYFPGYIDIA